MHITARVGRSICAYKDAGTSRYLSISHIDDPEIPEVKKRVPVSFASGNRKNGRALHSCHDCDPEVDHEHASHYR